MLAWRAPRWQDMVNGAHYSRSALPEHGLRKVASVDVAEQLGFADFLDAHAAHESSERPESVEAEPSPDEARRNRLIQMMQQYDDPPPPQYQPPPTSGLSLAELSIEPSTLDEAVLRPVLRSLDTAETLSRNTAKRSGSFKRGGIFSIEHRHQASAGQVGRSERLQQLWRGELHQVLQRLPPCR